MLLYVQKRHVLKSTFHKNIKMILMMHSSFAGLHAVAYSVIEAYETASLSVEDPCDYFAPPNLYMALHLSIALADMGMITTLMAACCERVVATIWFGKYERNGIALGLLLCALTSFATAFEICMIYSVDDFNAKVPSMRIIPPSKSKESEWMFILSIFCNIISIIVMTVTLRINRRRWLT
ncbi:unnamed protein product [Nippostrongylus brasiliensis]|uniref:CASP-like protein n=1 Tax=Nippostrongylus brasiliensis TaxID=27835 RepID=A0A0N4XWK1_NIPBR|nr:unnamed protein product [Nippostrongylus brasiliensis]